VTTQPNPAPQHPTLHLVPPPTRHHSPLTLWHLLSLDAPTVATLWTLFLADTNHIHLLWQGPAAMFTAVWMLYVADRLLDARPSPTGHAPAGLEERHRFHQHHRAAFLITFCFAAILLAALLHALPTPVLHLYTLLATLLAAWLLLIHTRAPNAHHRLPKELAVGIFFPAAVFIPTVANAPQLRLALLPYALLFAALCTLNCLFVYAWEHTDTRSAHATTRFATRHITALTTTTIALSLALAALTPNHTLSLAAIANALAATILLTLHKCRHQIPRTTLRALADAALLTPLLLVPFAR
jgi:hypothetical protein